MLRIAGIVLYSMIGIYSVRYFLMSVKTNNEWNRILSLAIMHTVVSFIAYQFISNEAIDHHWYGRISNTISQNKICLDELNLKKEQVINYGDFARYSHCLKNNSLEISLVSDPEFKSHPILQTTTRHLRRDDNYKIVKDYHKKLYKKTTGD
tara:strand:- start:127 stop:579 length:453 start_codon:yes stop_codon:yes gene_type:complete